MRATIILSIIAIASLFGCKKEEELKRSIFDLKIKVSLSDTNGVSDSLYFEKGEDIAFNISITNPVDKPIGFYYEKVKCQEPTFGFDVYDYQDNFIGNILPGEVNCLAVIESHVIQPGEVIDMRRTWFQPLTDTSGKEVINDTIPRGSYYMTYKIELVDNFVDERNEVPASRPVAEKIFFTVK